MSTDNTPRNLCPVCCDDPCMCTIGRSLPDSHGYQGAPIPDLFAGPGGWDVAARWLGLDVVGVETDDAAVATRDAAGLQTIHGSVTEVDLACFDGCPGLIASPPCQTFSAAGKGSGRRQLDLVVEAVQRMGRGEWPAEQIAATHDPRTVLVLEPLRWALALEPTWLAFEQVPQVLPVWEAMAVVLREHGWHVATGYVHSEQYGVPQTRKRAVLLAHRDREVGLPVPTHSRYHNRTPDRLDPDVLPWVSMAEALGAPEGAAVVSNYGTGGDPAARGERAAEPAATVTSKVDRNRWTYRSSTMPNSARRPLQTPAPTVAFGHDAASAAWLPEAAVPGDTSWTDVRPSPTIVGSFAPDVVAAPGYRKAGDPPRQKTPGSVRVTVQQAAVLQSFPADHPWQGSKSKQYEQVGNAVPPVMACALLAEVLAVPFDPAPAAVPPGPENR